ncbi:DUF4123 domain-containing protein [Jannaschia rubra]|uniref:DUF4123 domain-containing protein n=1 Tax=Jannaschia rubra TaxID=282197 RepID=A0A0M6XUI0_9RHOB|nr:DUF4123 domain-containing protein [Jannaschia rubra]CTQ34806.1 hypothetical protein JAN5088_03602 [Jannaschia rubra]SFG67446.1 protein of unknown function [Jannaschia rubra]
MGQTALRGELLRLAVDPRFRVLGVFDGALHDALPVRLEAAGVAHRALVTGEGELQTVGPWLADPAPAQPEAGPDVDPDDLSDAALADTANRLAADMKAALERGDPKGGGVLPGEADWWPGRGGGDLRDRVEAMAALEARAPGSAVFWILPREVAPDALWSHLRRIRQVIVPANHVETGAATDARAPVLLRHADGDVLTELLSALSPPQVAQFLGPAAGLLFRAPSHPDAKGGVLWRVGASDAPAPPGPLTLDGAQMDRIAATHHAGSRERVGQYLRDVVPGCAALDRAALADRVRAYEEAGDRMGLETERGHMKWAYLMAVTEGGIDAPETWDALHETEASPDARIDDVLAALDGLWDGAEG